MFFIITVRVWSLTIISIFDSYQIDCLPQFFEYIKKHGKITREQLEGEKIIKKNFNNKSQKQKQDVVLSFIKFFEQLNLTEAEKREIMPAI